MVKKRERRRKEEMEIEDGLSDDELHGFDEADDFVDSKKKKDYLSDEEVYGFGDSDDLSDEELDDENLEEEEDKDDFDMGSDIAEEEKAKDDRAWGKNNRRFYNTDYVDQDYEGFYVGKEAEEAELEEQEAKQIQKRLVEQLNEADFDLANLVTVPTVCETDAFEEIERDVSTLSKRQKLDLLQKESPEFFILVEDFKSKLVEINKILPILNYFNRKQETSLAFKYLKQKFLILSNYCTNISFYLLLKSKGIAVQNHPVLKGLFKYRKLLEEVKEIDKVIDPQIEEIQRAFRAGEEPQFEEIVIRDKPRKDKNILKLLSREKKGKEPVKEVGGDETSKKLHQLAGVDIDMDGMEDHKDEDANKNKAEGKRAITYEMAKNKGLMPKRSKEQRNPRVKHRKKYRKALIRRRGQVRTARSEIPVYGGEASGIKVGITKSIKFK